MGLLPSEIIKFLNIAEAKGIKGTSLAMMGKQDILVEWNSFMKTIKELGYEYDKNIAEKIGHHRKIDAYDFFRMFGFQEVHAVDYSEFEGADIIFDLNEELPENLEGTFDYVINGGTLEHVFDVAKAMKSMSGMVKKGGAHYAYCSGSRLDESWIL
jgi:SAM-dependent methyltransferase